MRYDTDHLKTNRQFMIGNGLLAFAVFILVAVFIYLSFRERGERTDVTYEETYTVNLTRGFAGDSLTVMVNDSTLMDNGLVAKEPMSLSFRRFAEQSTLILVSHGELSLFELDEDGGQYFFEKDGKEIRRLDARN